MPSQLSVITLPPNTPYKIVTAGPEILQAIYNGTGSANMKPGFLVSPEVANDLSIQNFYRAGNGGVSFAPEAGSYYITNVDAFPIGLMRIPVKDVTAYEGFISSLGANSITDGADQNFNGITPLLVANFYRRKVEVQNNGANPFRVFQDIAAPFGVGHIVRANETYTITDGAWLPLFTQPVVPAAACTINIKTFTMD